MYISVQPGRVEVLEATDDRRFQVEADACLTTADVGKQLADSGLGDIEGDHAWIDIGTLTERLAATEGFDGRQFEAMVAYARERGWVSNDGGSLRAHLVREGAA
ncbi:hypothetical protein GDN83_02120 [Gordonia jinghuaiqii]|uniref:Uncharacterized protein n=1 Tax=Gordonia jinghuaiqii TaxID=2758710 RepID=A0A7D7LU05_9ACTN|nr:hypothetical protein [Gordonia jinghuaiqii]MCR5976564.1 hypothetical protein [Gordonia jinghuaiqii]QMS99757.1 hypothetical protein H1R19_12195 [Gordonia jinghuaiqii]